MCCHKYDLQMKLPEQVHAQTRNMMGQGNRNLLNIWLLLKCCYLLIVKKDHKHDEQDLSDSNIHIAIDGK